MLRISCVKTGKLFNIFVLLFLICIVGFMKPTSRAFVRIKVLITAKCLTQCLARSSNCINLSINKF